MMKFLSAVAERFSVQQLWANELWGSSVQIDWTKLSCRPAEISSCPMAPEIKSWVKQSTFDKECLLYMCFRLCLVFSEKLWLICNVHDDEEQAHNPVQWCRVCQCHEGFEIIFVIYLDDNKLLEDLNSNQIKLSVPQVSTSLFQVFDQNSFVPVQISATLKSPRKNNHQ